MLSWLASSPGTPNDWFIAGLYMLVGLVTDGVVKMAKKMSEHTCDTYAVQIHIYIRTDSKTYTHLFSSAVSSTVIPFTTTTSGGTSELNMLSRRRCIIS